MYAPVMHLQHDGIGNMRTDEEEMATDKLRLTISLSDFAARKLTNWAKSHDKSRTAWAAQIVESCIEEKLDLIDKLLADCAKAKGMTPEELEKEWQQEEGKTSD